MFDKLKDLNKLRKAQSEIKKQLEQIYVSSEKNDMSVLIRGDKKIEKLVKTDKVTAQKSLSLAYAAIDKAAKKGSMESLIISDNAAFIVNVPKRKIITAKHPTSDLIKMS